MLVRGVRWCEEIVYSAAVEACTGFFTGLVPPPPATEGRWDVPCCCECADMPAGVQGGGGRGDEEIERGWGGEVSVCSDWWG
jgi:hypothetical protein